MGNGRDTGINIREWREGGSPDLQISLYAPKVLLVLLTVLLMMTTMVLMMMMMMMMTMMKSQSPSINEFGTLLAIWVDGGFD